MMNQFARYLPVLRALERDGGPILEVGCGSAGIGRWTRRSFVGCDRSFTDYGTAAPESGGHLSPVRGDAIRLPFRDRAFGLVLCMDTLEHIPRAARGDVVREISRVAARRVILGFPWGEGVSVWDRRLAEHLRRRGKEIPIWLSEHLALDPPDPAEVVADFVRCGFEVSRPGAGHAIGHYLLMCAEARPYLGRKLNSLSRRISRTLTGRPRHLLDPALVRLILALHPPLSRMSAARGSYRAYLIGDRFGDRAGIQPVAGGALAAAAARS